MRNYNVLEFGRNAYTKFGETETDEAERMSDVAEFIRILLKNEQQVKVWADDMAICVEFNYANPEYGDARLDWLNENEYIEQYVEEET